MVVKYKLFYFLFIVFLFFGLISCNVKEKAPEHYPDFSTPESTFYTSFYAFQHRDYKIYLDSLTEGYCLHYGKTKEEQLANFKKFAQKIKIDRRKTRKILNVQYESTEDYDVKLFWSEEGGRYTIKKACLYLKKVGNEWKRAFPKFAE